MSKKKRFISLLLVFTMVLSTILPSLSFAATMKDIEGTEYEEAIEKLVALDTIKGYEDGTFKPYNSITRAELATILVFVLGLQDAAKLAQNTDSQFTDVRAGDWYTGYINIAANENVFAGYPDGTFKPNQQVSYAEATTMMVNALGLKQVVDKSGGSWPSNYMSRAAQLGITKDIKNVDGSDNAIRGDICLMAWETLLQEQWGAIGFNDVGEITYGKTGKTLLEAKYPDFVYYDAKGNAEPKYFEDVEVISIPESNNNLEANQIEIKMENIANLLKISRKAASKDYAYVTDENGDQIVIILPDGTQTSELLGKDVSIFFGEDNEAKFIKVTSDANSGIIEKIKPATSKIKVDGTEYTLAKDAKIYINNVELNEDIKDVDNEDVKTKLTLLENIYEDLGEPTITTTMLTNSSSKISQLNVNIAGTFKIVTNDNADRDHEFIEFVVKNIRSDSSVVDLNGVRQFKAEDVDEDDSGILVTRNNAPATASDIEIGDVIMVAKNTDGSIRKIFVTNNIIEGTLEKIANNYGLTIDGTIYKQAPNARLSTSEDIETTAEMSSDVSTLLDENITLYLDSNDNYILVMGDSEVTLSGQYALVARTPQNADINYEDNDNPSMRLQIIDANGNKTAIKVTGKSTEKFKQVANDEINKVEPGAGEDWTDLMAANFTKGTFIKYVTDSDGKTVKVNNLTKLENATENMAPNGAKMNENKSVLSLLEIADNDTAVRNSNKSFKSGDRTYYVTDSTVILNKNEDKLEKISEWATLVNSNNEKVNMLRGTEVLAIYNGSTRMVEYLVINDDGENYQATEDKYGVIVDILASKNEDGDKVWMVTVFTDGELNTYEIADIATDLDTVLFGEEGDFIRYDVKDGIFEQNDAGDIKIDMEAFTNDEDFDGFIPDEVNDRDQLTVDEVVGNLVVFKKVDGEAINPVSLNEDDVVVYDLSGKEPQMSSIDELAGRVILCINTDNDAEDCEIVVILE
ncbi:MAG: S-layer homology domain-containing protein [Clostridia bacterium]|nr:S-layer homology domain-containing protein [Clostridia bacterium]